MDVSEELRERHRKNQNKATKKRMKNNKKKAKRINQNKRELFLNRWWRKTSVWLKIVFQKKKVNTKRVNNPIFKQLKSR